MSSALMTNYAPLPISFVFGQGAWLTATDGNAYLDAVSGIAVCSLGHAHPIIQAAIADQAAKLIHTSNLYQIPLQQELARRLVGYAKMSKAFFANSGAEANEAAIKLARLYGHSKGISKPNIIVMEKSFHGRTLATLTATGNDKVKQGFSPLVEGFKHIPYNNINALHEVAETTDNIVAVILEPILGEGGVIVPDAGFLQAVRLFCDENNCLMIVDEIQTGMGRTGKWFGFQHEGIKPDIITLAKALANGVPIGACLAGAAVADLFQPGSHGSTFGGNPLAARAALSVLDVLENESLLQRAEVLGMRFLEGFQKSLAGEQGIKEIRVRGLMIGIELDRDCSQLVNLALREKLLINVTAGNTVRLLPPLIINDEEADRIIFVLSKLIKHYLD